ncbi:Glycine receptor subunit alpha-3 [Mactra antiquata]
MHQTVNCVYSAAKETEIRSETVLDASYDMISRPDAQTQVKVGISILAIDELDLKSQKLSTAGWLTFEWDDSRLTWDPAAKDDIDVIFSKPGNIWKPELLIDNSLENLAIIADSDLYLRVESTGTVEWEPPTLFVTHCQVDITYYPYDRQKCSINIASWGYTVEEVALTTLNTPVNLVDFQTHGEWEIYKSEVAITNLTETTDAGVVRKFPQIAFWIYLSRRTDFYNLNVVMPIILTSLLVALTFIVPVDCGEKLSYILTVFLAIAVLLTLVADSLPPTSITTSVLGLYLGFVTVFAAVGILIGVLILILYHKEGEPSTGSPLVKVSRICAMCACSSHLVRSTGSKVKPAPETTDDVKSMSTQQVEEYPEYYDMTWKTMSVILDRFCFIVFSIVTVIMNLSFIIALVVGGKAQSL